MIEPKRNRYATNDEGGAHGGGTNNSNELTNQGASGTFTPSHATNDGGGKEERAEVAQTTRTSRWTATTTGPNFSKEFPLGIFEL